MVPEEEGAHLVKSMQSVFQDGQKALEISLLHSLGEMFNSRFKILESRMFEIAQQNQQILLLLNRLPRSRNSDSSSDYDSLESETHTTSEGRESCRRHLRSGLKHPQIVLSKRKSRASKQQLSSGSEISEISISVPSFSVCTSSFDKDALMSPSQAQDAGEEKTDNLVLVQAQSIYSQPKKTPETQRRPTNCDIALDSSNASPAPTEPECSTGRPLQPMGAAPPRTSGERLLRLPNAGTAGATAAEAATPSRRTSAKRRATPLIHGLVTMIDTAAAAESSRRASMMGQLDTLRAAGGGNCGGNGSEDHGVAADTGSASGDEGHDCSDVSGDG